MSSCKQFKGESPKWKTDTLWCKRVRPRCRGACPFCVCGVQKGEAKFKTMAKRKDLTGQRFGKLTVTEKTDKRKQGYILWRCRCDCGNELLVETKRLVRGSVTNCGCVPKTDARNGRRAEDLTGKVFGRLTVIRRVENKNGRTCWLCRCDCGKEKAVTAHDLKAGNVKSCGGHSRIIYGRGRKDLTGYRIGRLTVLYATGERSYKGSVYWHCRCDCGNEVDISEDSLMHGGYKSCGCLQSENRKKICTQLHIMDGTCIEMLEKRKYRRDNTSGFRGVTRMKNGRFRAYIGFKGKRYYIGCFEQYDEAVDARIEAEELIHGGFLQAYRGWEEQAEGKPQWKEKNPLVFEVSKRNGKFVVITENTERRR